LEALGRDAEHVALEHVVEVRASRLERRLHLLEDKFGLPLERRLGGRSRRSQDSIETFFTPSAQSRRMCLPMGTDPVNETFRMIGEAIRCAEIIAESPAQ